MHIIVFISSFIVINLYGASQDTIKNINKTMQKTRNNFKVHKNINQKIVILKMDSVITVQQYKNNNGKIEQFLYDKK